MTAATHAGSHTKRPWLAAMVVTALAGCTVPAPHGAILPVQGIPNAEDLAAAADGRWVIASSMAGGGQTAGSLHLIASDAGTAWQAYPTSVPNKSPSSAWGVCPGEVAPEKFAPHGVALHDGPEGQTLFVVNHGERESIEIFAIAPGAGPGASPALRWEGCIPLPVGASANGVSVGGDGTVYAANMGRPIGGGEALSDMGGDVLSWRKGEGWSTVSNSAMRGPNGLAVSPDGSQLFVAAWPARKLVALDLNDYSRRELDLSFLPDNVKWGADGNVLVTGHLTSTEVVYDCYVSTREACPIDSAYAAVDPETMTVRTYRTLEFPFATTAIDVGEECWLGTARGDAIGRLSGACERD